MISSSYSRTQPGVSSSWLLSCRRKTFRFKFRDIRHFNCSLSHPFHSQLRPDPWQFDNCIIVSSYNYCNRYIPSLTFFVPFYFFITHCVPQQPVWSKFARVCILQSRWRWYKYSRIVSSILVSEEQELKVQSIYRVQPALRTTTMRLVLFLWNNIN